jgi:hypoxanthine phosphoribosyltransferase
MVGPMNYSSSAPLIFSIDIKGTTMSDNVKLTFAEISQRLKALTLPDVDWVVGIATGGIVPASLLAHQLNKPLALLHINFRGPDNAPRYEQPLLLKPAPAWERPQRILLVDDVSVSGYTLRCALDTLTNHAVTTLALKGQGDIVVFPEIAACVDWPWKVAIPV